MKNDTLYQVDWRYLFPHSLKVDLNFMNSPIAPTVALKPRPSLLEGIPDAYLALFAPVAAYWLYSAMFHIIDVFRLAEKYRIHPSEEVAGRNKAGRIDVLVQVLLQHLIQTLSGLAFLYFEPEPTTGFEQNVLWTWRKAMPAWMPNSVVYVIYQYGLSGVKLFVAFFIIDSWQYWLHYLMHMNKTLYRKFHAHHHRLNVPYAYGALYNSPGEGFMLDTLGSGVAAIVTGLSHREQLVLFTFATMKTVDDHCGYALPWDPFQWIFPNNAVYHDIHHQTFGIKTNFSQPFFTIWDSICNTKFPAFKEYEEKQRRVTIDKYKQFLAERAEERKAKLHMFTKKAQ
ncbi:HBR311Wp [Eremothecium sinecaudum]|uniref:HBR311Wp n=1 Tax=Eremothecium sinecaudum TaxID=45286 RepID=A0A109UXM9_9SACH|nr:HBR311Wp [Eremothecium sinecaudum]AMD19212.1 HBR311Wp [Eremothecium sinecaudum]